MPILGAHMSVAGGFYRAVESGIEVGCECIQIFCKNNKRWQGKPIETADCDKFKAALDEHEISPQHTLAHASYLINLATPNEETLVKSRLALVDELERASQLGVPCVVFHPGSFTSSSEAEGIQRIIESLDYVLEKTEKLSTVVLLENVAGQGTNIGWRFDQLSHIINGVQSSDRLGVCIDTCHTFAAGYPLSPNDLYEDTVNEMDKAFGLDRIRAIHLNDSKHPFGSRKDRHQHIGIGQMGEQPFRLLLNDKRFQSVPMYLETEKGELDGEDMDAMNLRVLRNLIQN